MNLPNGVLWKDTAGNPIHAHGGGILGKDGYYYWFGENRLERRRVSCYRSTNLVDWQFRGDVLTLDSPFQEIDTRTDPQLEDAATGKGCNIERPKVIYNKLTGKYVMWMHWENGQNYSAARAAIASCDTPDGSYIYHGSFNPIGHMSRDCTLFVDDDGKAYFISAARGNADLHVYRLADDYLSIDKLVRILWPGQYREAPAVVKKDGIYFMLSSACTGWAPNQGKFAWSASIDGDWSMLYNFGDATTFDTQPTYILPVEGKEGTEYLYIGDRWNAENYHASSYAMLKLEFPDAYTVKLNWNEAAPSPLTREDS